MHSYAYDTSNDEWSTKSSNRNLASKRSIHHVQIRTTFIRFRQEDRYDPLKDIWLKVGLESVQKKSHHISNNEMHNFAVEQSAITYTLRTDGAFGLQDSEVGSVSLLSECLEFGGSLRYFSHSSENLYNLQFTVFGMLNYCFSAVETSFMLKLMLMSQ